MKHIGWRLELCRKKNRNTTFVRWYDLGMCCAINDDGTFKPEFNWLLFGTEYPEWKQTEVKSITKVYADD